MQNKTIFRRLMTFIISLLFVFNSSAGVWANSQTRIAIGTVNAIQEGQATVSAIKEDNPLGVAAHGVGTALNVVAALSGLKAVVPTNSSYMEKLQCMKSAGNEPAAKASAGAVEGGSGTKTLYHYTNEKGLEGIIESKRLNPSLKANNPKDARYGNGQYLSDINPQTSTPTKLAKKFINVPNKYKYTHYAEIDVSGLNVIQGRDGVFVIPNEETLDLTGRIINSGKVGN